MALVRYMRASRTVRHRLVAALSVIILVRITVSNEVSWKDQSRVAVIHMPRYLYGSEGALMGTSRKHCLTALHIRIGVWEGMSVASVPVTADLVTLSDTPKNRRKVSTR